MVRGYHSPIESVYQHILREESEADWKEQQCESENTCRHQDKPLEKYRIEMRKTI